MEQWISPGVRIESTLNNFLCVVAICHGTRSQYRGRKEVSHCRLHDCSYRQAAAIMAAKGKRLVVSLKNGFVDASPVNQKVGRPCPVPMDEIVKGMSGI